MQTKDKNEI